VLARVLALPREAGTAEGAAARAILEAHLRSLGYDVTTQRFSFHPRTLDAFPLFGIGLGGLGLALMPLLLGGTLAWAALAVWVAGVAALGAVAAGVGLGWTSLGGEAREDANLVATRGSVPVRRWIVAHADTKAQGHSMAGRIVAVWVVLLGTIGLTAAAIARLGGPLAAPLAAAVVLLAVIAGALAARGRLRGRSPGARDNGSGLLAALTAAAAAGPGTGILITGAEEFGLVGARIFARIAGAELAGTDVVNVDTVDDVGTLYVISHDRRGAALAHRVLGGLGGLGVPARTRALPLGIFVDSHPLARAGAAAVTIGRLDWSTLRRLHTARDTPDGLTLELAERIGEVIARAN
jgi:hypothetical protein